VFNWSRSLFFSDILNVSVFYLMVELRGVLGCGLWAGHGLERLMGSLACCFSAPLRFFHCKLIK